MKNLFRIKANDQMNYKKITLALFDFDGTITKSDSLLKFICFAVGNFRFAVGLIFLSPILIGYKLSIIPNYKAKSKVLSFFFKGYSEKEFKKVAQKYSLSQIDKIVRPKAYDKFLWHKEQGHKIVIVSASIECWLGPWCRKNGFDLLATKLEIINGKVTGNILGKNCYGIEKVCRIKEKYDLSKINYIYAYGDSIGDKQMLELADETFFRVLN